MFLFHQIEDQSEECPTRGQPCPRESIFVPRQIRPVISEHCCIVSSSSKQQQQQHINVRSLSHRSLSYSNRRRNSLNKCLLLVVHLLLLLILNVQVSVFAHETRAGLLREASPVTHNHEIHKRMTKTDLRSVFQVDSHEEVPDYDVVDVRIMSKRSVDDLDDRTKQVNLKIFGRQMHLKLKPNSDFNERVQHMKVFIAETKNGQLKYSEESNNAKPKVQFDDLGETYHDDRNMAAVLLRDSSNGRVKLEGTIGNDVVIKPVPSFLSPDTSSSHSLPLSSFGSADGRDDDEMFLDEDEAMEMAKLLNRNNNNRNLTGNGETFGERIVSVIPKPHKAAMKPGKGGLVNLKSAHIVYKKKMYPTDHQSDFLELEPGITTLGNFSLHSNYTGDRLPSHRRTKRQSPDTVWPEVLLVVDYDSYVLHGANSRDVKRYFISFWNGVDLRYKLLSHPTIRVSLAGMIVAKDRDATPYLERNRLRSPNADAVDAAGALTDMGKYLYREDRLPTYDLAVVITKLDMCRRRYEGGRCNRGTAGFAYVGGACVVNKRLEKVNSVAIIEDSGGFSGIIVAAHEVGHLLGCVHDGSPPPSYLGGPGATRCPWEDGYIMSDLRHTERGFKWSACSTEQFKHFLNGETATCLYNFPHENQLLPRVLPGTMLTLDEQCKRDRGTNACFKDGRVCAQLFCFDSASGYCVSYRPAAEGSSCGDGQTCRNGKCITEIENIIPDYTHVTQTVHTPDHILSRSDTAPPPVADSPPVRSSSGSGTTRPRPGRGGNGGEGRSRNGRGRNSITRVTAAPSTPIPSGGDDEPACRDTVDRMAGSLTCTEFLQRFGYRYCNHHYVKRNCCESQSVICAKKTE